MRKLFEIVLKLSFLSFFYLVNAVADPWKTLGVSRSASTKEIKSGNLLHWLQTDHWVFSVQKARERVASRRKQVPRSGRSIRRHCRSVPDFNRRGKAPRMGVFSKHRLWFFIPSLNKRISLERRLFARRFVRSVLWTVGFWRRWSLDQGFFQ